MRRKRRRRARTGKLPRRIIELLVLVTFVGMAAAIAAHVMKEEKSKITTTPPAELMPAYISCLQKGDYESMYAMLSEKSRKDISKEDYISRNKKIYEGIELSNVSVKMGQSTEPEQNQITVSYTEELETMAGTISFDNKATYLYEEGSGYGLVWNDSLIFPELTETDKVKVSTLEAKRGEIVDRNGTKLAVEGQASSVGLIPGKMSKDKDGDIKKLAKLLELSEDTIQSKLNAKWVKSDSFVPLKTVRKVDELALSSQEPDNENVKAKELEDALLKIKGVMITTVEQRSYPLGEKAAHLVGYVQSITADELKEHEGEGYSEGSVIGKSGAETLYEKELKGTDGCTIKIVTKDGKAKTTVATKEKNDGATIKLTIDAELQSKIYDEYKKDKSCSVAMNPYTGEVLALVSTPSFDSNDFVLGMSEKKWDSLNNDAAKPLYNRFRQVLCPGSTFKPVIAAVGLQAGVIDTKEDYKSEGTSWQKDKSWGSYKVTTLHTFTPVTMENALIYSDNIYFAKAALKIGKDKLQQGLTAIGFTKKLPFDITMATSKYSNSDQIEGEIQLADTGYGQGQVLVNPLHLATIYTAFANDGNMIQPYLQYDANRKTEYYIKNAFTKENAQEVKNALIKVVNDKRGTAYSAARKDVELAGKTGTAEIKASKEDKNGTELGWFASFTTDSKADLPILMVTMVEDVKNRGGSSYVVKKTSTILDTYLKG
ncbi:MAG: penicillin-binding transpeptidase domain-containing protein [bacterium]|nr:penicillin-binding transpeptidase domain-containing protein [bacterium]